MLDWGVITLQFYSSCLFYLFIFLPDSGESRSLSIWIDIFILYERGRVTNVSIFMNTDTLMWNWRHGTGPSNSWNKYLMAFELTRNLGLALRSKDLLPLFPWRILHSWAPHVFLLLDWSHILRERIKDRIGDGWSLKHKSQQSSFVCVSPYSLQTGPPNLCCWCSGLLRGQCH